MQPPSGRPSWAWPRETCRTAAVLALGLSLLLLLLLLVAGGAVALPPAPPGRGPGGQRGQQEAVVLAGQPPREALLDRAAVLQAALDQAAQTAPTAAALAARLTLLEFTDQELAAHVGALEALLARLAPPRGQPASQHPGTASPPPGQPRDPHPLGSVLGAAAGANSSAVDETVPSCVRPELPRWCYAFQRCGVRNIALIGNGPLSPEQRRRLNSDEFQVRVRFNFQNNRAPGEATDVWVMRFAARSKAHFWGVSQMGPEAARAALAAATSLWFLGYIDKPWNDHRHLLQPAYRHFPEIAAKHHLLLDHLELANSSRLHKARREGFTPSSGFVGASYALECAGNASVHLFGFNWNAAHTVDSHDIQARGPCRRFFSRGEERVMRAAAEQGLLVIHDTPCTGLRDCGLPPSGKHDCHVSKIGADGKPIFSCLEEQQS